MGGVREPLDHRIARAADAVAREKDRVDSWNLLPSEYFRLRRRVCRAEGQASVSENSEKRKGNARGQAQGQSFGLTASVLAGERRSEAATRKTGPPLESGT